MPTETIKADVTPSVLFFPSLEEQIEALRAKTSLTVPRMSGGRQSFFEDVVYWVNTFDEQRLQTLDVIIPPDPSLALTLPYPRDEISLALAISQGASTGSSLEALFKSYGLDSKLINRPTVSLSGGERLLLAFLKADILAPKASSLVLCSPTQWLFSGNYHHLDILVNKYASLGKPVTALFLRGEPLPNSLKHFSGVSPSRHLPIANIDWRLTIKDLEILYPATRFPMESQGERIRYLPQSVLVNLKSPTIFSGDNGIGKSTFAKVLSGQLTPAKGFAEASTAGFAGPARYLFQDSIDQLFGESIKDHLSRVFRFDEKKRDEALSLFEALQEAVAEYMLVDPDLGILGDRGEPDTLLQAKLALIAERLASKPPLLILDEPGWGLSEPLARILLSVVCAKAVAQKTAILFISHTPLWWSGLMASEIYLSRSGAFVEVKLERV